MTKTNIAPALSRRAALTGAAALIGGAVLTRPQITRAQNAAPKSVRIIVALADNQNQGLVPTTAELGDGQSPRTNLYWGALYGVKTHFGRSKHWTRLKVNPEAGEHVLDTASFAHPSAAAPTILVRAEAWDGAYMTEALQAFYDALSDTQDGADLTVFVGHNGLMDALPVKSPNLSTAAISANQSGNRAAMVLACHSRSYFESAIENSGVDSLVLTTGLMAPEAYSLEPAIRAWAAGKDTDAVRQAAAAGYARYQKIPLRNAQGLFAASRN